MKILLQEYSEGILRFWPNKVCEDTCLLQSAESKWQWL